MFELTIFTSPLSRPKIQDIVYNVLRFLRSALAGRFEYGLLRYGGHYAVTGSLIRGLTQTGIKFNYNPKQAALVHENVVVLSNVPALREAILLKRRGQIKKLFAGPNLVNMADDYNSILSSPEIDALLVPSKITIQIYRRLNPKITGKILAWPAGVNEAYWSPVAADKKPKDVLVYIKDAPRVFCNHVENILKSSGFRIRRLVYGKYSPNQFRQALRQSRFAVFLSVTETQGLALAEAWSADVPTLVWDPKIEHYFINNLMVTSAPYLTPETGVSFREAKELQDLLQQLDSLLPKLTPRKWVLEHMTDAFCARHLVDLFQ